MKQPSKSLQALQYVYVLLGTMSMAFAVVCFLSPNNMVTGGGIGIALIKKLRDKTDKEFIITAKGIGYKIEK